MVLSEGSEIWSPLPRPPRDSELDHFMDYVMSSHGIEFTGYSDFWKFSVTEVEAFWDLCWRYFRIVGERPQQLLTQVLPLKKEVYQHILTGREMPGFRFFPESKINFAENAFNNFQGKACIVSSSETRPGTRLMPASKLWDEVSRIASGLRGIGVSKGDRVVGYLPNIEETLVAFLASASIGAVWSCCAPDFGPNSVIDRFAQIEPKVLFTIDGYKYAGKDQDRKEAVREIIANIPSLRAVVAIDYAGVADSLPISNLLRHEWKEFGDENSPLKFERVEFSEPLWILYSSGTTGLPKAIVHGHGGITLELKKVLSLHQNLGPGSRFFWYTTTGWMMWNFLVGGLLVGTDIVLFDGSPAFPDLYRLWHFAEETELTQFGASAPYISNCIKAGVDLHNIDLSKLRLLGSTGAPLPLEGFEWLHEQLGSEVQIVSVSGGTDVCTAFLTSSPLSSTYAGKLSVRALGAAIESFDADGHACLGSVGELVITEPMPSMPVFLWGDSKGTRFHSSYFEAYAGIWNHGDWIRIDQDGSSVIYGRSDSTLNRGGIRMGTAEFYRIIESFEEVGDSLVVDTSALGTDGEIIAFLVMNQGSVLDEKLIGRISTKIRQALSPRHVPDRWIAIPQVPRTLNGKKVEIPVRKMLLGEPLEKVVSAGALANPESLKSIAQSVARLDFGS